MSGPTGRVLQLLSLLQTHRFWPGPDLAGRLEVSARTLRRDVERLRELGYEVEATPGNGGGYRLAAGAHLPPLVLDDDEAVAIAVGLITAAEAPVDGIEPTSLRALAKLEQLLPDHLRRRVSAVRSNVVALRWDGPPGSTVSPADLGVLAQGCRDGEEVRFDYQSRHGELTNRLVQPHQLVAAGRRWYLVAWDSRRADWRTFRVDRLTSARLAGLRFAPREIPGGDAAAYVARALGSLPRSHEARIVLAASPVDLEWVSRWWGATVEEAGGGCTRVRLQGDSVEWLALSVARLAATFEVRSCEPGAVAEAVAALGHRLARVGSGPVESGPVGSGPVSSGGSGGR